MNTNTASWSRVVALAIGYVVALAGVLSIYTVPFYASLVMMAVGTAIGLLSDRTRIRMTWRSWTVMLAGWVVIFCVLTLFGEDRIRHWRPFPGLYIAAWLGFFHGFRHVRHLVLQIQKHRNVAA